MINSAAASSTSSSPLRRLELNGMVERAVLTTRPIAVEYRLTRLAHSAQPLMDARYHWTTTSLPAVTAAQTLSTPTKTPSRGGAGRAARKHEN